MCFSSSQKLCVYREDINQYLEGERVWHTRATCVFSSLGHFLIVSSSQLTEHTVFKLFENNGTTNWSRINCSEWVNANCKNMGCRVCVCAFLVGKQRDATHIYIYIDNTGNMCTICIVGGIIHCSLADVSKWVSKSKLNLLLCSALISWLPRSKWCFLKLLVTV